MKLISTKQLDDHLVACQGCLVEWGEGHGNTCLLGISSPSTPLFETYMLEDVVKYHGPS